MNLKEENEKLRGLLVEARTIFEMWKDVAPAISLCADIDKALAKQATAPAMDEQQPDVAQPVTVPEIIEAVANFVGSQKGGPFTPAVIKAAIIGQLEYGDAFTKLFTSPVSSHSHENDVQGESVTVRYGYGSLLTKPTEQQPPPDVTQLVEALEEIASGLQAEYAWEVAEQTLAAYRAALTAKGADKI